MSGTREQALHRPIQGAASAEATTAAELNLSEYAARLVGHRLGVRRLEARMLELQAPTTEQLAQLIGELEALDSQGSLLAMYARLLPDEMKRSYGQQASAADAVAMLRHMVQGRQTLLAGQASVASAHQQEREIDLLARLQAKLARIVETGIHAGGMP
jgi:hypothetical protein